VVTDTWTSMGDEAQHDARVAAFQGYQVNAGLMAHANEGAVFMHCLPAHRGEEVTDEVMGAPYSVIYDEAGNRLHAQKAVMSLLMGVPAPAAALEAAGAAWGDAR
jgi:ornithine carbamoyltransferase